MRFVDASRPPWLDELREAERDARLAYDMYADRPTRAQAENDMAADTRERDE